MKVSFVVNEGKSHRDPEEAVQANLEAIARAHKVSVDELLKSAESAGPGGPAYLNRALVLKQRLDKLQANE